MEENTNNVGVGVNTTGTQADSYITGSATSENAAPVSAPVQPQSVSTEGQAEQSIIKVPDMLKAAQNQPPVTSDEKIWGLVSYIPLMALMALVLKPSSDFIKLHGRQGLLIFLIFFFSIFVYLVPFIGPLIGVIIHFALIAIGLFSMYQAFIGNWWKIPVLGDISELIPVELFAKVTREAVVGAKVSEEIEQKSMEEQQAKAEEAAILNDEAVPAEGNNVEQNVSGSGTINPAKTDVQQQLPISGDEGAPEGNK